MYVFFYMPLMQATRAWWPFVQPKTESILPGMSGQPVPVSTGEQTPEYEWGSEEDSYYEVNSFNASLM